LIVMPQLQLAPLQETTSLFLAWAQAAECRELLRNYMKALSTMLVSWRCA